MLSFGLTNAPSLFQRIMDLILSGLSWECCLVFVDDIIVFSNNFDEHVRRLGLVLDRFWSMYSVFRKTPILFL